MLPRYLSLSLLISTAACGGINEPDCSFADDYWYPVSCPQSEPEAAMGIGMRIAPLADDIVKEAFGIRDLPPGAMAWYVELDLYDSAGTMLRTETQCSALVRNPPSVGGGLLSYEYVWWNTPPDAQYMRLHAYFGNGSICGKRDWGTDHGILCSLPAEDVTALPINQHTSREYYTYEAKLSMDIDWYATGSRHTFTCNTDTQPISQP